MALRAEVAVLFEGQLWESEVMDISASGLLIGRPEDWSGSVGQELSIDLLLADDSTIPLKAKVVRSEEQVIALQYSQIPSTSEIPLWTLLGAHADKLERERHSTTSAE